MVDITNLLSSSSGLTPLVQRPQTDSSFSAGFETAVSGNDQLLRQSIGEYNAAKLQENRASLVKQEAEYQKSLAIPKGAERLQQAALNAIDTIAKIDETQRLKEIKKQEAVYLSNSLTTYQNQVIDFLSNNPVPTDGQGYAKGIISKLNEFAKPLIESAPTAESQLELNTQFERLKQSRLEHALKVEEKQREAYRDRLNQDSINKIGNQLLINPSNIEDAIAQIDPIKEAYKVEGKDAEFIKQFENQAYGYLLGQSVKGFIRAGTLDSLNAAEDLLRSDEALSLIPSKVYESHLNEFRQSKDQFLKEQERQQVMARAGLLITQGLATKDTPGAVDAADDMFFQFFQGSVRQLMGSDMPSAVNNVAEYIRRNGSVIGKQTQSFIISSVMNSQDPQTAGLMAQMLTQLSSDEKGYGSRFVSELPKEVVTEAATLSSLINIGYAPMDAMIMSRKELRTTDVLKKQGMENLAKSLDDDAIKSVLFDAYDTIVPFEWTAGYAPQTEEYAKRIFKTEYVRANGNMDVAATSTRAQLQKLGSITYINGRKEFLLGMPKFSSEEQERQVKANVQDQLIDLVTKDGFDWYSYDTDVVIRKGKTPGASNYIADVFKDEVGVDRLGGGSGIIGKAASGESVELGIMPIHGVTVNEPNNNKSFIVWDYVKNRPYISRDGQYKKVIINEDETEFGRIRKAQIATYTKERDEINALTKAAQTKNNDLFSELMTKKIQGDLGGDNVK